jgi:hypothetical protein
MISENGAGLQDSGTTAGGDGRIEGPIAEFDRYDEFTGEYYFRCTECRQEAMHRRDLTDCCERFGR